jgi:hypothetical protein
MTAVRSREATRDELLDIIAVLERERDGHAHNARAFSEDVVRLLHRAVRAEARLAWHHVGQSTPCPRCYGVGGSENTG